VGAEGAQLKQRNQYGVTSQLQFVKTTTLCFVAATGTVARIRRERDHALEMSRWWCGAQLRTRGIGWWCHEWCNAEAIIDKTQMSDIERGYGIVTPTLWYKEDQCSEGRAKTEIAPVLESLNVLAPMA
jgi:hypothetical protein